MDAPRAPVNWILVSIITQHY